MYNDANTAPHPTPQLLLINLMYKTRVLLKGTSMISAKLDITWLANVINGREKVISINQTEKPEQRSISFSKNEDMVDRLILKKNQLSVNLAKRNDIKRKKISIKNSDTMHPHMNVKNVIASKQTIRYRMSFKKI